MVKYGVGRGESSVGVVVESKVKVRHVFIKQAQLSAGLGAATPAHLGAAIRPTVFIPKTVSVPVDCIGLPPCFTDIPSCFRNVGLVRHSLPLSWVQPYRLTVFQPKTVSVPADCIGQLPCCTDEPSCTRNVGLAKFKQALRFAAWVQPDRPPALQLQTVIEQADCIGQLPCRTDRPLRAWGVGLVKGLS